MSRRDTRRRGNRSFIACPVHPDQRALRVSRVGAGPVDERSGLRESVLSRKADHRVADSLDNGDRAAGYRYQLSILQAEFSLTQMLDKPV